MAMKPHRKIKLYKVLAGIMTIGAAIALMSYAFRENINLFYTPSDVSDGKPPIDRTIRVGGLVVIGTVNRNPENLEVSFAVTDKQKAVCIYFDGILPDLFREGQGIVALGKLDQTGRFNASEVLAKHDENYMSPEVAEALKLAEQKAKETEAVAEAMEIQCSEPAQSPA